MKKNLTELVFILDRSGSMTDLVADTIGGYDSMIEKYKSELEEAYVTTVLFDDCYQVLHDHVKLQDVGSIRLHYYVRGCTALYDAVGKTINSVGERLFNTPEEERPEKVIFVIVTDGYENASKEFSKTKVREMIEHQQSKYSWAFMFLGANIAAEDVAEEIGINRAFSKTYAASSKGVSSSYDAISNAVMYMSASCDSLAECENSVRAILDSVVSDDNSASALSAVDISFNGNISAGIPINGTCNAISSCDNQATVDAISYAEARNLF